MGITTVSRFELTNLQTLISQALSTSEQTVVVKARNSGEAVNGAPFITVNMLEGYEPGLPQRRQVDDFTEEITEHRVVIIRIQGYGSGAFTILQRLRAWFGSSPGMQLLKQIGVSSPSIDFPKDISAAVSTGFEERALMNATISYADVYRIEQETIAEVPLSVITDDPPSQTDFTVIIPE
ncbi:MAG TPA: hypothetical protein VGN40_21385 [Lelliottia sp.]